MEATDEPFDLFSIGVVGTRRRYAAGRRRQSVAVVEKEPLGCTRPNRVCIPSKNTPFEATAITARTTVTGVNTIPDHDRRRE
ncbi:hypothetical protein [Natrarchaeobius oligotrophus]|uniref:Uncharacterized protein n=1 Tax=Natrarchaeobius chitinivorans TaxID=1679083 RepID=A0A3N6PSC4_NATCH|nr:hypothetical protein [Natrarchaeobius chitinivorans]RQH02406.1 hypothetical protein EA472_03635 [Natrarchaeobius chitinivorans]